MILAKRVPALMSAMAAVVVSAGVALADEDGCAIDKVDLRGDWGAATFQVEIADDPQERAIGLMNRPSMPRGAGMLFYFDRPQPVSFWMRNTLIPLDMIFIGVDGSVHHVHENAIPLDETSIFGGTAIFAVLEINGGLSEVYGIGPGTEVRHPGFPAQSSVWPCP